MQVSRVLSGAIALGAASFALALSVPEPATLENMAGTWVGVGLWGTHYRLVIEPAGHGQLAIKGSYDKVVLYEIESISFERQSAQARLHLADGPDEHLKITGEAIPERALTLAGKRVFGNESVRFYPEAEWLARQAALEQAMRPGAH